MRKKLQTSLNLQFAFCRRLTRNGSVQSVYISIEWTSLPFLQMKWKLL